MDEESSDAQLLADHVGGRSDAFARLVGRHRRSLVAYANRRLQNAELAEEVCAGAFATVALGAGRFVEGGTVRGWLFTLVHHRCVDLVRRERVERAARGHVADLAPRPRTPEAAASDRELAGTLGSAIASLPEPHREIVRLRLVEEWSADEAGRALGLSAAQVDSGLSYARRRLRALLSAA